MPSIDEKVLLAMEEHYQSPRQMRKEPEPTGQPPLTPMIDVTFQLLIFFLLTSTFSEDEGQIPGKLPAVGGGRGSVITPLTINISNDGEKAEYVIEFNGSSTEAINAGPIETGQGQESKDLQKQRNVGGDELYERLKQLKENDGLDLEKQIIKIEGNGDVQWKFMVQAFNAARRVGFAQVGFATLSGG